MGIYYIMVRLPNQSRVVCRYENMSPHYTSHLTSKTAQVLKKLIGRNDERIAITQTEKLPTMDFRTANAITIQGLDGTLTVPLQVVARLGMYGYRTTSPGVLRLNYNINEINLMLSIENSLRIFHAQLSKDHRADINEFISERITNTLNEHQLSVTNPESLVKLVPVAYLCGAHQTLIMLRHEALRTFKTTTVLFDELIAYEGQLSDMIVEIMFYYFRDLRINVLTEIISRLGNIHRPQLIRGLARAIVGDSYFLAIPGYISLLKPYWTEIFAEMAKLKFTDLHLYHRLLCLTPISLEGRHEVTIINPADRKRQFTFMNLRTAGDIHSTHHVQLVEFTSDLDVKLFGWVQNQCKDYHNFTELIWEVIDVWGNFEVQFTTYDDTEIYVDEELTTEMPQETCNLPTGVITEELPILYYGHGLVVTSEAKNAIRLLHDVRIRPYKLADLDDSSVVIINPRANEQLRKNTHLLAN